MPRMLAIAQELVVVVLVVLALFAAPATGWPPSPAALALQARITAAAAAGEASLEIAAGKYEFGQHTLTISGATDFAVRAAEPAGSVTLIFDVGGGVRVVNCTATSVSGITVGYDPVVNVQGRILALDAASKTIQYWLDPGFPMPNDPRLFNSATGNVKMMFFDNATLSMPRNQTNMFMAGARQSPSSPGVWTITAKSWRALPAGVGAGSPLVLSPRIGAPAFVLSDCHSCKLQGITLHNYPNIAIASNGGYGNNTMQGMRIDRNESAARLSYLVGNMGALNSDGHLHGYRLLDNHFAHIGDDFMNSHNQISLAVAHVSDTQLAVAVYDGGHTVGLSSLARIPMAIYRPGHGVSAAPTLLWQGTLVSAARTTNATLDALAAGAAARLLAEYGQPTVGSHPTAFVLETAEPLPAHEPGTIAYVDLATEAGSVAAGNHFFDGYARAGPFKPRAGKVVGNSFRNTHLGGLLVTPDFYFLEGTMDPTVLVADNVFQSCGWAPIHVCPWCAHVTLRNNTILP